MNNKNILTDKLGEIDSKFLDEYHDRRSRRALRRKNVMKYCSIAASVMLVITISIATMFPMFRNTPTGNPVDTSTGVIDNQDSNKDNADSNKDNPVKDNNKPDYSDYTVIYAKDEGYSLGDKVEAEDVYYPQELGEIVYYGDFSCNDTDTDDNILYAVRLSGMNYSWYDCTSSEQWKELYEYEGECAQKEQEHSEKIHNFDAADAEHCTECAYLREQLIKAMNARDEFEMEFHNQTHLRINENVLKLAESQGYEAKVVTLIPKTESGDSVELNTDYAVILHLTLEQLKSFEPSPELSLAFELIPQWMDTDEEVIYVDTSFYFRNE